MDTNESSKIKALKDSIVEECRKQGFTLDEFARLVDSLRFYHDRRKDEYYRAAVL